MVCRAAATPRMPPATTIRWRLASRTASRAAGANERPGSTTTSECHDRNPPTTAASGSRARSSAAPRAIETTDTRFDHGQLRTQVAQLALGGAQPGPSPSGDLLRAEQQVDPATGRIDVDQRCPVRPFGAELGQRRSERRRAHPTGTPEHGDNRGPRPGTAVRQHRTEPRGAVRQADHLGGQRGGPGRQPPAVRTDQVHPVPVREGPRCEAFGLVVGHQHHPRIAPGDGECVEVGDHRHGEFLRRDGRQDQVLCLPRARDHEDIAALRHVPTFGMTGPGVSPDPAACGRRRPGSQVVHSLRAGLRRCTSASATAAPTMRR